MIRFKVIKASRLLLGLAIALLVAVLGAIVIRYALAGNRQAERVSASLVEIHQSDEAKTQAVFASSLNGALPLDPEDGGSIDVEIIDAPRESPAPARHPSVLIYHTHTHEAYEQVTEDPYEAVEAWRTTDADHSVVRVGEVLANALEGYGFEVVHDVTDHENDALSTAYTRSLATLERYERSFDLYIDLHRDAYVNGMSLRYTDEVGTAYAQPMLLIGNGNGFDVKPYYEQNYAFARALTNRINRTYPGLCKSVLVKDGRYNQHIGIFSVLIEVGHNLNTLEEALNTAPVIADAIYSIMVEEPDPILSALAEAR